MTRTSDQLIGLRKTHEGSVALVKDRHISNYLVMNDQHEGYHYKAV
jgi:hypothetical protein